MAVRVRQDVKGPTVCLLSVYYPFTVNLLFVIYYVFVICLLICLSKGQSSRKNMVI